MKENLARAILVLIIAFWLIFAIDYLVFRHKISAGDAYGSVVTHPLDASRLNHGRVEYYSTSTVEWRCVNSIFPHKKFRPCWYMRKSVKENQRVDFNK